MPLVSSDQQRDAQRQREHCSWQRTSPPAVRRLSSWSRPAKTHALGESRSSTASIPGSRGSPPARRRSRPVGEQRQQQRVDHQPGRADDRESPEPGGELAKLQAAELAQVPQRLAWRGLGVARIPRAEAEGDLGHAQVGMRTRISRRILKPRGRRQSRSTASRRTRKHPLIGSLTCHSRVGNSSMAARVDVRESAERMRPKAPLSPPAQNRLATTTSAAVANASEYMSSSTSGGCWRSASITQT